MGRGPWAGPLVVGAVILPDYESTTEPDADEPDNSAATDDEPASWLDQLTDSKRLTKKRREALAPKILAEATTGLGWVSARELDAVGMSEALRLATRRAVLQVRAKNVPFTEIIIDGTVNFLSGTTLAPYVTTLKKADLLIKEVSAASIIAKVARDQYMTDLATVYPGYGFENHVGYGTAAHKSALESLGPTSEHRHSFKPVAKIGTKNTTALGKTAEGIVADFLESRGHTLFARNHKTKFYEIDLITIKDDHIYFTEVKYRKTPRQGSPFESITKEKQQQMRFAAEAFLKYSGIDKSPLLAVAAVEGEDFKLQDWFTLSE